MTENDLSAEEVSYRRPDTPVTLPTLATVGVKLLGLYALLQALPNMAFLPAFLWGNAGMPGVSYLIYVLPTAAYLALGCVFLFATDWVVTRVARIPATDIGQAAANEHVQAIAFSLVGVLLVVRGVGGIATAVVNYAAAGGGVYELPSNARMFAMPAVELIAGLVLFLRGRGLAALWHRMRYGGVRVRAAE